MRNIIKYLSKHYIPVIAIVALLVIQAICDLKLPEYTSDVVNVGIQQSGIEEVSPDVMREESLQLMYPFLAEDNLTLIQNCYQKVELSSLTEQGRKEFLKQYPLADSMVVYEFNGTEEEREKAGLVIAKVYALISSLSKTEGALEGVLNGTAEQRIAMYQKTDEGFSNYSASMINTIGAAFAKSEYEALGRDIGKIQTSYILRTGAKMLGVSFGAMFIIIIVSLIAARVAASIGKNLRTSLFKKVVSFSNTEMDRFSTASLITRSTNDIQQVQMVAVLLLRMVVYAPILGIGGIIKVVHTNTSMSWIIFVAVAAILAVVLILFKVAMPKFKMMQSLVDRVNLVSREILTGLSVIRAFGTEKHEEKRFDGANQDLTKTMLFTNRVMSFMMPFMFLIMNCVMILIVWYGGKGIELGELQVGDMIAFMTYTMQIVMSFLMLTMVSIFLPRAAISATRIDEVLMTDLTIMEPESPKKISDANGKKGLIEFENVSFRYPNADEDALENITFTALPGKTTAFIGSTGSGKSTLVNLIPRFYDVTKGSVKVDGIDVREITQKELHDKLGYVPQKAILFSGTIDSNLRYGKEDATEEEIKKAAAIAQSADFIEEKENKYFSSIAQGGSNVSGGQKQRLSIARAIAKKPEIFIFDDSFSALDFKTDVALRKAIQKDLKESTVLIVAQRISTILNADQIIVLDEGKIVGIGTHKQLLAANEVYQQIAASQLSQAELSGDLDSKEVLELKKGADQNEQ
ncbi:ABC transporter ATP-binding protein [Anaeromicropila populeti]|uniref:ATP-binding cassette, subfamily B n=1 Tax=Anaeromicropila populeti TaxID=37658 RepID=A0A1I6IRI1_9FIRM|nr:ABC transporter ATP-binding protein [Anaeromicropila populeti]SFR68850.1 ATP-binding cassette, subfamily B [Anaeromicropila populeti]